MNVNRIFSILKDKYLNILLLNLLGKKSFLMTTKRQQLEKFQKEIGNIFDDFLEYMSYSVVKVELESFRRHLDCLVVFKLFKCRSCTKPFIKSVIRIQTKDDLGHLAKYLDTVSSQWRLFHPSDLNSDSDAYDLGKYYTISNYLSTHI